ncbi:hypothetical protein LXA43DRAFT_1017651 [Ganoderma leucocontextum]|nr:hypothetical protein LXA43DRAFT_1017651 [Ganoderma leucocontextum]
MDMSLSSFLLPGANKGKAKAIDKSLDDLFRSTASAPSVRPTVAPSATTVPAPSSEKKRKATEDTPNGKAKRSKVGAAATPSSSKTSAKPVTKAARIVAESESEEAEDGGAGSDGDEGEDSEEEAAAEEASNESDDEGDPSKLVHEALQNGAQPKGQSRHGKPKFIPADETQDQRSARTIFVGNVAVEVTKSRPAQKQFKRHILSFVPSAKIESVRYRSVAFKKPTAELPDDNRKTSHKPSKTREHDRDRAAAWRANEDEDEAAATPQKQYLTPKEKKRIAFIKHDIHEHVDAVNAYVVFAHPPSAEALAKWPANLPPPAPVMDPYDAASACSEKGDGSVFLGRTLRMDVVKKGARPTDGGSGEGEQKVGGAGEKAMAGDPKATLFVGNLEFTSKEEDLRAFFESVVTEEMGKPGGKASSGSDDEEDEESDREEGDESDSRDTLGAWVKRVRIIRDKDTQLGKGFAYVQFVDRECVDEVLALDQSKLKFAKRKLRVQRCKTLPGGPKLRAAKMPRAPSSSTSGPHGKAGRPGTSPSRPERAPRLVPTRAPKGNPELGAKLAHLPKEERKKAKAADADRIARRLAKKRAKALAEKGVKSKGDRERVRKRTSERKEGGHGAQGKRDKPKKRVRSGNALMKMNTKK